MNPAAVQYKRQREQSRSSPMFEKITESDRFARLIELQAGFVEQQPHDAFFKPVTSFFGEREARLRPVYIPKWRAGAKRRNIHRVSIERRIARLRDLTQAAGDPFNRQSADLLVACCNELAADRKPGIFPLLNGNLRAIWENEEQEQIAIQFLPDGKLQYVLFRLEGGELIETLGTESNVRRLHEIIKVLDLGRLWYNDGR